MPAADPQLELTQTSLNQSVKIVKNQSLPEVVIKVEPESSSQEPVTMKIVPEEINSATSASDPPLFVAKTSADRGLYQHMNSYKQRRSNESSTESTQIVS